MALGLGPGHSRYRGCKPVLARPRALWTAALGPREGDLWHEPFILWTERGVVCAGPEGQVAVLDAATGARRFDWPEPWRQAQPLGPLVWGLHEKSLTARSLESGARRSTIGFEEKPELVITENGWLVCSFNDRVSSRRLDVETGATTEDPLWTVRGQLLSAAAGVVWTSAYFDIPDFEGEVLYAWDLEKGDELWRGAPLGQSYCAGHSRMWRALSDGKRLISTLCPQVVERDTFLMELVELGSDDSVLRLPEESPWALAPDFLVHGHLRLRCTHRELGLQPEIEPMADTKALVVAGDAIVFANFLHPLGKTVPPALHAARWDGTPLWSVELEPLGLGPIRAIDAADGRLFVLDAAGVAACLAP